MYYTNAKKKSFYKDINVSEELIRILGELKEQLEKKQKILPALRNI